MIDPKSILSRILIATAVAVTAAPLVAAASDRDPLGALVEEALAHNLSLTASRLDERRAAAERTAALLQWLPSARLESRASRLHDVPDLGALLNPAYATLNQLTGANTFPTDLRLTLPSAYDSHLRVTQPLVHEPLRASVSAAGANLTGAREALRADARRLAATVQAAYLRHASLRRVVGIEESALVLVLENERVAERLLEAGHATPEAVHRARADRAEVEQQLADAREQVAAAARELNRTLGRPVEATVETLPDSVFDVPLAISADAAVRSALAGREELAQADASVRAAEAGVRAATGAFLPNVAAVVDVGWQGDSWSIGPDERAWSASLVASWDLFRSGSDLANRSAARASVERARTQRRDLAGRITVEALDAHEAARVAREAVGTAASRVEAARRTWTLVHRRYEEGSASPLELTDARTTLTTAETNQVLTLYRYALRRVDLERAAALRDLPLEKGARR